MNKQNPYRLLVVLALFAIAAALIWRAQASAADPHSDNGAGSARAAKKDLTPSPTSSSDPPVTPELTASPTATTAVTPSSTSQASPTATTTAAATPILSYLPVLSDIPPPARGCEPEAHIPGAHPNTEREMAGIINAYRQKNDERKLTIMPHLTQAARRHAFDMANNEFTDHTGSDDSKPGDRVSDACYNWVNLGEILGTNSGTEAMFNAWARTGGNKALILAPEFHDMGVAYVHDPDSLHRHYWVVVFGRPASAGTIVESHLLTANQPTNPIYRSEAHP